MKPTKDEIRVRAYFLWEAQGKPQNHALDNWIEAEIIANYEWHKSGRLKIQFPKGNLTIPFY